MALKEEVLGQFLGDEKFPVEWSSETEKLLFWVYDDLHCPHPLSPMYEDIGGWWLSCDHMFRRFGAPFATDWIAKNVNGYLYTAAIPAEAGLKVDMQEYGYATTPVVPSDPEYAAKIGTYLGAVLPTYGLQFVNWWRDRLVPEMDRNFAYIEGMLDKENELSLMELACLLEDAIDIHDRHWKIHWMLNFAQLSATLNLRAVMEKTHGKINEQLLGRLQNSAKEILEGLQGEALEEMRAANEINLRMAPLTPDHHFYIDQGANAHVRLVLVALGKKLVAAGALDAQDDVVYLKYNEFRVFMGNPAGMDARAIVAERKAEREKAYTFRPKEWIGTATKTQLAFPYLNLWGFPDKFYRKESTVAGQINGLGGSPGVVEGIARVVLREDQFDDVRAGDILVCQMTNPAWVVLFTKIVGLVTDAGGTVSHPAVLSREFGIPAVVGTSVATQQIKNGDRVRINGTTGLVEILVSAPDKPAVGFKD